MTDEEIIDKILSRAKEKKSEAIPVKMLLEEVIEGKPNFILLRRIVMRMEYEGIGKRIAGDSLLWLPNGLELSEKGYLNCIKQKGKELAEIKEHEQIVRKKDEVSLNLSQYQFKYRWLPIIAIGISLFSLILSLFALFK